MKNNAIILCPGIVCLALAACNAEDKSPRAASGVQKASVRIQTGPDGLTTEQRNIKRRLEMDNKPGSIKHLYVVSSYSGQVILYSTIDGKISSSGKRLTPKSIVVGTSGESKRPGFNVMIGSDELVTSEVLQDDGTYGDSGEYLYWFDTRGDYYQYYVTGGAIPIVTTKPLAPKSVVINVESAPASQPVPAALPEPAPSEAPAN